MATGQGQELREWCNTSGTCPTCRNKMELLLPGQLPAVAPSHPWALSEALELKGS